MMMIVILYFALSFNLRNGTKLNYASLHLTTNNSLRHYYYYYYYTTLQTNLRLEATN
jgi:hypothetical protein